MGADLIGTTLVISKDKEPDWKAAEKWAENLTADDLMGREISDAFEEARPGDLDVNPENIESLTEEEIGWCVDERRSRLVFCVKETKEAYEEGWRNTMTETIGGKVVFTLAETSWGDSPEGLDEITLFQYSGAAKTAGFDNE